MKSNASSPDATVVYVAYVHTVPKAPKKPPPPWLGTNIRRFRKLRGLSVAQLIDKSGDTGVKGIESGKRNGSIQTLLSIAKTLDVDIGDLLADPDAPAPEFEHWYRSLPESERAKITDEERGLLRRTHAPGLRPTDDTFYWELKKLQTMKPDQERSGERTKNPSSASPGHAAPRRRGGGRV